MQEEPFPRRIVQPKLLPEWTWWLSVTGWVVGVLGIIITAVVLQSWLVLTALAGLIVVATALYPVWMKINHLVERSRQYDSLYNKGTSLAADKKQLEDNITRLGENFERFLKALIEAGLKASDELTVKWNNDDLLLLISLAGQVPTGAKVVVISLLDAEIYGNFEIAWEVQGGYLARALPGQVNPNWWKKMRKIATLSNRAELEHTAALLFPVVPEDTND